MPYDLYPAVDENYDFPQEVRVALSRSLELRHDIEPMTTVLRNNLTAAEKWDGRVIVNTDTDRIERYDLGLAQWIVIPESSDLNTQYVKTTGNETIGGIKTFSSSPVLPANATTALQAVPKQQLDAQSVRIFANASVRDSTIPSPTEGMMCYLLDLKQYQAYDAGWYAFGGIMPAAELIYPDHNMASGSNAFKGNLTGFRVAGGISYNPTNGYITNTVKGRYLITFVCASSAIQYMNVTLSVVGVTSIGGSFYQNQASWGSQTIASYIFNLLPTESMAVSSNCGSAMSVNSIRCVVAYLGRW